MTTGSLCRQQGPACHHPLPRTRARTRTREGRCLQAHLRWNWVPTALREGDGVTGRAPELQAKVQGGTGNIHTSAGSGKQTPSPTTTPDQGRGVSTLLFPGPAQTKARFWGGGRHLAREGRLPYPCPPPQRSPGSGIRKGSFSGKGESPDS